MSAVRNTRREARRRQRGCSCPGYVEPHRHLDAVSPRGGAHCRCFRLCWHGRFLAIVMLLSRFRHVSRRDRAASVSLKIFMDTECSMYIKQTYNEQPVGSQMFLWISVDNSCRNCDLERQGADSLSRPHRGLRLQWSSPQVSGRANKVAPEVSERFPHRGFDRLRTSFHLAHQHRALNSGDTEISQPILGSVCREATLCLLMVAGRRISPMPKFAPGTWPSGRTAHFRP
jgi:hypothetical protein